MGLSHQKTLASRSLPRHQNPRIIDFGIKANQLMRLYVRPLRVQAIPSPILAFLAAVPRKKALGAPHQFSFLDGFSAGKRCDKEAQTSC